MTTTDAPSALPAVLAALHHSHDLLDAAAGGLTAAEVSGPAYPTEWSIAQVLSHLGSGAEIGALLLASGLSGSAAPGQEDYTKIWDVWNAKDPVDQVSDGLVGDAALLAQVDATTAEQRAAFGVQMFNGPQDLAGFLKLRLSEHAMHTWDVRVALDPAAGLPSDAAGVILDSVPALMGFIAHPTSDLNIAVQVTDPDRELVLQLRAGGGSSLTTGADPTSAARLRLPAEAFVRLLYGRLDPDHTPSVTADGVDLADLRTTFPGF